MNYRDNLTEKFAANLQCGFGEYPKSKIADLTSSDEMIKLAAGYTITDLSYEGIEKFVTDVIERELHGISEDPIPSSLKLDKISQSPLGMGIENASGTVTLRLTDNVNLEIPFMVAKGELIPFDVIQLGNERCPYTRENLAKIIMNVKKKAADANAGFSSGYAGIEPRQNASTTSGFLTNMLQIRSRGSIIPDAGGIFVTASEKAWEDIMDKLGAMKPYDWGTVEKVAAVVANRDKENLIKHFSDLGAENVEMVKTAATQSALAKSQPWKRLSEIPDRTFVKIPEKNGKEFSMTAAYVIKNFDESKINDSVKGSINKFILVITADHRFMTVDRDSKIICLESPDPLFSLKANRLKEVKDNDTVLLKACKAEGGKYFFPMKAEVRTRNLTNESFETEENATWGNKSHPVTPKSQVYTVNRADISVKNIRFNIIHNAFYSVYNKSTDYNYISNLSSFRAYLTKNPKFKGIHEVPRDKACSILAYDNATSPDTISFLMSSDSENVVVANEEKKCIILGGTFGKTFNSFEELEAYMSLPMDKMASEDAFDGFVKTASTGETVTVTKMNDRFNVTVKYNDRDGENVVMREEKLSGINEEATMGALLGFGFSRDIAKGMIVRASNSGSVSNALPPSGGAAKIFGGRTRKIKRLINKIKNDRAARIICKSAAAMAAAKGAEVLTKEVVSKTGLAQNPHFIKFVFGKLASDSDESMALSREFEKKAVEYENKEYRKIAKALGTAHMFAEASRKVVENPYDYPFFDKIAADIVSQKKNIENMVSGLVMEKVAAYNDNDFKIHPSYYTRAVYNLNNMFSVANDLVQDKED